MYDYFLNGKDHYAADRETAEKARSDGTAASAASPPSR
jgi:hypothetical protein